MCECMIKRVTISTPKAAPVGGPFCQATLIKNTVFVSSCIGIEVETNQFKQGSIIQQMEQALHNLNMILQEAGSCLSKVSL